MIGLILPTVTTYIYFFALQDRPETQQQSGMALAKIIQFALPLVWLASAKGQWPTWKKISGQGLLLGAGSGLAILVVTLALFHLLLKPTSLFQTATQAVQERVQSMGFESPLAFLGLGAFYVVFHSLLEEYYWRWFVFGGLRSHLSVVASMLVSSLGFMAHHVLVLALYFGWTSPATYFFSACVAVGGAFWAWLYQRSEQLYAPWLSHALVDAAIFIVGYQMIFSPG